MEQLRNRPIELSADDELAARSLYHDLLRSWNDRDARRMASLFTGDASVIGFDGSPMDGRTQIESEIGRVFADHQTARYVATIREIRALAPTVVLVRAVAGMVPPGGTDINPKTNAMQILVAVKNDGRWSIASYQNTPAAFHGRTDAAQALTDELRQVLRERGR